MKMKHTLISSLVALALPAALSEAAYFYSFESPGELATYPGSSSSYALSTTGVSQGSNALEITEASPASYWDVQVNLSNPELFWSEMSNSKQMTIDITSTEATGNTGGWGLLKVALVGGGLYLETGDINVFGSDKSTILLDYTSKNFGTLNDTSWAQIHLAFNADAGMKQYADNLVVVPEPAHFAAVFGLIAIGAVAYLRRRKS